MKKKQKKKKMKETKQNQTKKKTKQQKQKKKKKEWMNEWKALISFYTINPLNRIVFHLLDGTHYTLQCMALSWLWCIRLLQIPDSGASWKSSSDWVLYFWFVFYGRSSDLWSDGGGW